MGNGLDEDAYWRDAVVFADANRFFFKAHCALGNHSNCERKPHPPVSGKLSCQLNKQMGCGIG